MSDLVYLLLAMAYSAFLSFAGIGAVFLTDHALQRRQHRRFERQLDEIRSR